MTKSQIINEIKRTAEANGGVPLGMDAFATETGIKENDWRGKFWARWNDAVREAGLSPNQLQKAYSEAELLDHYARLALQLDRLPTVSDLKLSSYQGSSIPEWSTFMRRFESKPKLIAKLLLHCSGQNEYADLRQWCETYLPNATEDPDEDESSDVEIGFVYLIKSGRFYKIGRSNAAGRREYELTIQLPEKAKLVHEIRTDSMPSTFRPLSDANSCEL